MNGIKVTEQHQLDECLKIRTEVFVKEQGVPLTLELDEYDVSPAACHHFLIMEHGKPVATGRWKEYEPGVAKFQRIAVLLPYRGRAIGRLLISLMEKDAASLGYREGILDAQCSAEKFYAKLGYHTISDEPFYDADILHVRMRHVWHEPIEGAL